MQARGLRKAVQTILQLYPIPVVFTAMLVFATSCLGGAIVMDGSPVQWVLAGTGAVTALSAIVFILYIVVRRSELLRVERHFVEERISQHAGSRRP